ncbi:MAG: LCP family protein [Clostridiales bacterium]|nr:LCP family protein [Clostridiales bacterium]
MKKSKNKKKYLLIILSALLLIAMLVPVAYVVRLLNKVTPDDGLDFKNEDYTYSEEDDDVNPDAMYDITDASSLNDLLYKWANNNGKKLADKSVINVLLLGVDSASGTMSGARSDAIILASVNKKTKKITLISIMRDTYSYMNINGKDRYFKINAAYNWGGPATLVKTIENNYKIEIDNFVAVDFATFPRLIDALGGIEVPVKEHEATYLNRSGHNIATGASVKLNGKQALAFSRIRYSDKDGDISRTRRHRIVITAIINKTREASLDQIDGSVSFLLKNVRTDLSRTKLLTLSTQALIQAWMNYEVEELVVPSEASRRSAIINTHFVWVSDFPLEANSVQLALYQESNIIIDADRRSVFDLMVKK